MKAKNLLKQLALTAALLAWGQVSLGQPLSTPRLTLTAPGGGGKYYGGDAVTVTWTSANIAPTEEIKIEVAPNGTTYGEFATSLNDGTETVTIPAGADYSTTYKLRIRHEGTGASSETGAAFTVVPVVPNIATFKGRPENSVAKIGGEVVISFIRTKNRNQKYVQDATGGLLIDDAGGVITTAHNQYDGIAGLEGKLDVYNGTYQLVPTVNTAASSSTGNVITPTVLTLARLKSEHVQHQSKLVKVVGATIKEANGTKKFEASSASSNYTMQQGTEEAVLRQNWKAGETNLIGAVIPQGTLDIVGIVTQNTESGTTTPQLAPRALADLMTPKYTVTFTVTSKSSAVDGATITISSQNITTNASGVATIDLPNGTYPYTVSKSNFKTADGSVTVSNAPQAVSVSMTPTGVGTSTIATLNVYPNPFSHEIRFNGEGIARVTITSVIGQVVLDRAVVGEQRIDTQSLSRGIYLVRFTNAKGESVLRKLVKE